MSKRITYRDVKPVEGATIIKAAIDVRPPGFSFIVRGDVGLGAGGTWYLGTPSLAGFNLPYPCALKSIAVNARVIDPAPAYIVLDPAFIIVRVYRSVGTFNQDQLDDYGVFQIVVGDQWQDADTFQFNGNDNYKDLSELGLVVKEFNFEIIGSNAAAWPVGSTIENNLTLRFERI